MIDWKPITGRGSKKPSPPKSEKEAPMKVRLPKGVDTFVLLIAASKGGTGKSTLSVHLAVAAEMNEISTIIFDTDIEDGQKSCVKWAENGEKAGPVVRSPKISKVPEAIKWARAKGFGMIVIDTAGRDVVLMNKILELADFMLTPCQPSVFDLRATSSIRRLWQSSKTPGSIVLNGITRANSKRARYYIDKFSEIGTILSTCIARRVQYIDAIEKGQGVSEFLPGGAGDKEMRSLLAEVFAGSKRKRRQK